MAEMLTYSGILEVVTCWCGMRHAVPSELRAFQLRQHENGKPPHAIYCPLGHGHEPSGKGEAQKLREQLAREVSRHDQTKAELASTEARRRGEKAAKTRIMRRVGNGVCPCCKRHFANLGRHMAGQHPGFAETVGQQ